MTSVTIVRRIKGSPAAIFEAFVRPEKIMRWWSPGSGRVLSSKVEPHVGGAFSIRFEVDGAPAGADGVFEVFDAPHRLALSWKWIGEKSSTSRLEISIRPIAEGTELTLVHSLLSGEDDARGSKTGWNAALDNLERLFEQESRT